MACLTPAQITQTSLGVPPTEEISAHLRTCAACTEAVAEQTVSMMALQRRGTRRPRSHLLRYIPTAAAAVLVVMMVTQIPRALQSASVLGANTSVAARVERDGATVARDVALQMLTSAQAGDQIYLHVEGSTRGNAYVQSLRDNKWVTHFEGSIPYDGWLNGRIDARGTGKDTLNVMLCTDTHTAAGLRGKPIPLDCTSYTTTF